MTSNRYVQDWYSTVEPRCYMSISCQWSYMWRGNSVCNCAGRCPCTCRNAHANYAQRAIFHFFISTEFHKPKAQAFFLKPYQQYFSIAYFYKWIFYNSNQKILLRSSRTDMIFCFYLWILSFSYFSLSVLLWNFKKLLRLFLDKYFNPRSILCTFYFIESLSLFASAIFKTSCAFDAFCIFVFFVFLHFCICQPVIYYFMQGTPEIRFTVQIKI